MCLETRVPSDVRAPLGDQRHNTPVKGNIMSSTSKILRKPTPCRKKKTSPTESEQPAEREVSRSLKHLNPGELHLKRFNLGNNKQAPPAASISKKSSKSSKKQANRSIIPLSVKEKFPLLEPDDFTAIEALPEPTMEELLFWLVESVEAMGDSPAVHAGFAQSARCAISLFAKIRHKEAA